MATNYKDIYYRHNPRKNIKCNPLYTDSYKPYFENFSNPPSLSNPQSLSNSPSASNTKNLNNKSSYNLDQSDFNINGGNYEDSYSYIDSLEEEKINLLCKNNKYILENRSSEKMYDLNLDKLVDRKKDGEIKNIDMLHNAKIIKSMNYNRSHIESVNKISNRLIRSLNDKVVRSNQLSNLDDPFFSHPAHNNYKWKNSYFKQSTDKNIRGKWWNWKDNYPTPLNAGSVIDYRNKQPAKVNYNTIDYKN